MPPRRLSSRSCKKKKNEVFGIRPPNKRVREGESDGKGRGNVGGL